VTIPSDIMQIKTKNIFFLSSFIIGLIFAWPVLASINEGMIDSTDKYAWSENAGWINFGTSEGNVRVTDSGLTGYAWSENLGWISLNCSNDNSCGTVDYKVANDEDGNLSGYAWGENTGWINFNPDYGGVHIGSTGEFSGYAWGENIGWVIFNCANTSSCGTVNYKVKTDYRPKNARPSASASSLDAHPADAPSLGARPLDLIKEAKPTPPPPSKHNPTGGFNFLINGGAEYTNSRTVKLKLFAGSDTKYMLISENPNFSGAKQEKYVPDKTYTLSRGDGKKTIYAKFLTLYDVASKTVSDSIILDTSSPSPSIITNPKNSSTIQDNTPTLTGTAEPDSSIILELQTKDATQYYSTETDNKGNWDYTFLSPLSDEDYTLKVTSQDQAGNLGKTSSIHFKIQTQAVSLEPEIPAVSLPVSPPSEEEKPTPTEEPQITPPPTEKPLVASPEEQPVPEQEEPTPSPVLEKQASVPPADLTSNVTVFESLYGNISLKPSSPEMPLALVSGQKLKSFVKPEKPVKAIKVMIIFQKPAERNTSFETKNNVLSSILGTPSVQAQTWRIAEYTLTDENNDGIYEGEIILPETTGTYLIRTTLFYEDGTIENLDTETLIDPKGYIYTPAQDNQQTRINRAAISLYVFNTETNQFELWSAAQYDQQNPQETDQTGEYEFLVPEGRYYLKVEAKGYQTFQSEAFQAKEGDFIHQSIKLSPIKTKKLNWLLLGLVTSAVFAVPIGIFIRLKKIKA